MIVTEINATPALKQKFAVLVREKRVNSHITQEHLAEVVEISEVYLRKIETGKATPNWIIWLKICTALDIDLTEIQRDLIEVLNFNIPN